jgi:zinc protease
MTSGLLDGGTATRSALQISDQLALRGAELHAYSNLDMSLVELSALKGKLDPSLELFADVILNPTFPESDFKRQQKQVLAAIEREQNTPVQMALRVLPRLLYGTGHAYGNPLTGSGTTETISSMTREDLVKFHNTWYHPNNATLVIVGDTTLAEIKPKLERLFASWKPAQVPKKNVSIVSLPQKSTVYLIDKPGALQSVIIAGIVAPPQVNPKEIAMEAMNDDFGGMFASRLNLNLREDKHWSYGARSILWPARGQRPFIALGPVQTDKTKESLEEMSKEFRGILGARPITGDELSKVQANETLTLPGSRETQSEVGQSILDLVRFGLPDDYYETYAGRVRALQVSDLEDAAKTVIHPDSLIWVIVGDRSKIEAGAKELNLGDFHLLSPDGNPL